MSDHEAGAALLVAGHGVIDEVVGGDSTLHTLGQIGEALLATGRDWQLRRLAAAAGERETPSRASLKRYIVELCEQPVPVAILAIAGLLVEAEGETSLVTGAQYADFPQDATLPLDWIRKRLRICRAERLVVVLSAARLDQSGPGAVRGWLDALGTLRPGQLVAVDPSGATGRGLSALLAGLRGAALDPRTGTITLHSLGEYLQRSVAGVQMQASPDSLTVAHPPPLGGAWDARLSTAPLTPLSGGPTTDAADLAGTVLPGGFRMDRMLARGSFGAVYQANQLSVKRDVAVKVLHAGVDPTSDVGRLFVQEIQSVGQIKHANVVNIYHADLTAGRSLFYAMELLAGRDLQQLIEADGKQSAERAVPLVRQLLAGLGAAHDVGLVHADVKPANAILVPDGEGERVVLVDFGLARLRSAGQATSAGGTPAYMAPEQLRDGRVDGRSDLFAAALVLVTLLTGWRRSNGSELVPPLDGISPEALRAVLARALQIAPDDRFQSAREFAAALAGEALAPTDEPAERPPFRHLAPFTEVDASALRGRDRDIAALVEAVLYRRTVIYTAPSGTGKTSLLRAGLAGRLEALGMRALYMPCRVAGAPISLAAAIWPDASSAVEAVRLWQDKHAKRLVLVLDQLEAGITAPEASQLFADVIALDRARPAVDIGLVLSVREDYLAGLLGAHAGIDQFPVLRLGPLRVAAAREAITAPLALRRVAIDEDLLAVLLADLRAAAKAIAAELRWRDPDAVYPPHLQLACSVLYDSLGPDENTLTLAHYKRLGGLDAIVGEYLDRVLDTELPPAATEVARELLTLLVTPHGTRTFLSDREVGELRDAETVASVLDTLRVRGLVVRIRSASGDIGWELVHDSLVDRVLKWLDRGDLARRRAAELVRYRLRRSTPQQPSLLTSRELAELRGHESTVDELEPEYEGRGTITPRRLLAASRRARRIRRGAVAVSIAGALALASLLGLYWLRERDRRLANIGITQLRLAPYDWHDNAATPAQAKLTPHLYESADGAADPTNPIDAQLAELEPNTWRIEAPSKDAILVVDRGTECPPSIVPIKLRGYAEVSTPTTLAIPTCQASRAAMVEVPAGAFVYGGRGEPWKADPKAPDEVPAEEHTLDDPGFWIGETEVTNAQYRMFRPLPTENDPLDPALAHAHDPDYAVGFVQLPEARSYCRYLGGDLPTNQQWTKALRGPIAGNSMPRRNVPWGEWIDPPPANVGTDKLQPVKAYPKDRSPVGVYDLAGGLSEWVRPEGNQTNMRGCAFTGCDATELVAWIATLNIRPPSTQNFGLGFRCVLTR
ncbi:MAG TPA: SUMF1/EgtB/PvdO family nonheme iron enzyme [Kofleriaceae bacterium]